MNPPNKSIGFCEKQISLKGISLLNNNPINYNNYYILK